MKFSKRMLITLPVITGLAGFIFFNPAMFVAFASATAEKQAVVVIPVFTISAYQPGGFYDYYCTQHIIENPSQVNDFCKIDHSKKCGIECLTVPITVDMSRIATGEYSYYTLQALRDTGYSQFITDEDIDRNPAILDNYKQIIVLHSEYVTQKEYDALNSHNNTVFLAPNAMYAIVSPDYVANTITLVKGHGYNGYLNWKYDNTEQENNTDCSGLNIYRSFQTVKQLQCNPESAFRFNIVFEKWLILTGI